MDSMIALLILMLILSSDWLPWLAYSLSSDIQCHTYTLFPCQLIRQESREYVKLLRPCPAINVSVYNIIQSTCFSGAKQLYPNLHQVSLFTRQPRDYRLSIPHPASKIDIPPFTSGRASDASFILRWLAD